jgi:hypothetical protein
VLKEGKAARNLLNRLPVGQKLNICRQHIDVSRFLPALVTRTKYSSTGFARPLKAVARNLRPRD